MEKQRVEVLVETRKEAIFCPLGGEEPIKRVACFLKPCIGGPSSPEPSPPSLPPLPEPFNPRRWPLTIQWKGPVQGWALWVEKMRTLHEESWRRAGIYEGVMGSTCRIIKDGDLVVGLAERWDPATKSFVFPWGEATVTLEDLVVIGGYSVLGCPVFTPLETEEMVAIRKRLVESRLKLQRSSAKKATLFSWLREFKDRGSKIEHEAFLALWLSRYVLANVKDAYDVISENSFPIAVLLARGTRVALAPAVLARIYNDMALLKEKIVALGGDYFAASVSFPLQLVQVWAWERFLDLQPEPNVTSSNETLLAKWDKVKPVAKEGNIRLLLNSSKGKFTWRPYVKSVNHRSLPKVYAELGNRLVLSSSSDEDLLSFARFLRVSELVGVGCIEQYLPHRVAMQFGFDQDVPFRVIWCGMSPEIAWRCYTHSGKELMCQFPSCLDGAGVTARYLEWWRSSGKQDAYEGAKRMSSFRITPKVNKDQKAASISKRLKVPVCSTSREMMKKTPSTYFKGTIKTSNGQVGRNSISSFRIAPKRSNISATSREKGTRVLPTCPGFLKKSSVVAGSSRKHNESIPSADRREEQTQVLPISTGLLRKSSHDVGIQNTSIPCPLRKTREGLSFKPERKKSLVRFLLASQNMAQRLKRKRLEYSKFDARAAARKIAKTSSALVFIYKGKEIHKRSAPPGFQTKDLPGQNPVRCSESEVRELPEAGQCPNSTRNETGERIWRPSEFKLFNIKEEAGVKENPLDQLRDLPPVAEREASPQEMVDLEEAAEGTFGHKGEANAAEVGQSKAKTAIEVIDLEKIIDLEEEEVLIDKAEANSGGEIGRSDVGTESEENADQQLPPGCPAHGTAADDDYLFTLKPELAARVRSLKADFARLIAERKPQQ